MTDTMTEEQELDRYRADLRRFQRDKHSTAQALKQLWGVRDLYLCFKTNVNTEHDQIIAPSPASRVPLQKQQQIIDAVAALRNEGWAFFGQPGTGKTTLSNALFHHAAWYRLMDENAAGGRVLPASLWRMTARAICQQAQDRATHSNDSAEDFMWDPAENMRAQRRIVSRERIERAHNAGLKPHLFIEEWDKVGLTDFRRETLFDILDCMYNVDGQSRHHEQPHVARFLRDLRRNQLATRQNLQHLPHRGCEHAGDHSEGSMISDLHYICCKFLCPSCRCQPYPQLASWNPQTSPCAVLAHFRPN